MTTKRRRRVYRATQQRAQCHACEQNIRRGMPVVYVDARAIHASCERLAELADSDCATPAPRCPSCGLVMSHREAAEQGACNECSGGAYDPRDGYRYDP